MTATVTIYHNPNCGSSRNALAIVDELGVDADVVLYLKTPPDADTLRSIIAKLEDPVTDLVRRDSLWKKLGLTDADVETPEQVVDVLVRHKQLLQRPLVVTPERAIIGRPKERVRELLEAL
jgi:arsenate reductase